MGLESFDDPFSREVQKLYVSFWCAIGTSRAFNLIESTSRASLRSLFDGWLILDLCLMSLREAISLLF